MLFFYKNVLVLTKSTSFLNNDFFRNQQRETFKTDQKYSNAVSSSRVKWWSPLGENAQWKNACSFTSFPESSTRYLFQVEIQVEIWGYKSIDAQQLMIYRIDATQKQQKLSSTSQTITIISFCHQYLQFVSNTRRQHRRIHLNCHLHRQIACLSFKESLIRKKKMKTSVTMI